MAQRLFIGNLPHASSEDDLRDFVSNAGFQVDSVAVIRDKMTGRSRGFGFVELAEGEDMKRAIEGLNGQELEGRRLTVNEARPARSDSSSRPPRGGPRRRRRRPWWWWRQPWWWRQRQQQQVELAVV